MAPLSKNHRTRRKTLRSGRLQPSNQDHSCAPRHVRKQARHAPHNKRSKQKNHEAPAAAAAVAPKKPKKDYPTVGTIIEAKWSTEFGPGKEWYRGKIAKVHAGQNVQ